MDTEKSGKRAKRGLRKLSQTVSYIVFAAIGASIMYGVWYVTEAEEAKTDLALSQVQIETCSSELVNAQADLQLEKAGTLGL